MQLNSYPEGIWIEQDSTKLVIYQRHPTEWRTSQSSRNLTQRIVRRILIALLLALIGILLLKPVLSCLIFILWLLTSIPWSLANFMLLLYLLPIMFFPLAGLMLSVSDVAYTFDLSKGEFTSTKQSSLDRSFKLYHNTKYRLSEITQVRLIESQYQDDEGTKFDNYKIHLDRVSGRPITLYGRRYDWQKLRDEREIAQQLAELIDEYLYLSRPEA